jgi:hypothetical protein
MRLSHKGMTVHAGENQLFGMDFHDFIQKDQNACLTEIAAEFGVSANEVRKVKKQMERN